MKDDPTAALEALLQALRLWNRAAEHLARLNPPPGTKEEDLFAPTEASKPAPAQSGSKEQPPPKRVFAQGARMNGFEWRIAEGTLRTLFALSRAYLVRGSAREAEYFAQQAEDLAQSIRAPAMVARALARRAEVQLHCAKLEEGEALITQAGALLPQAMGVDAAEITRLHGLHRFMTADGEEAQQSFARSLYVLSEAEKALDSIDR
jgi:separase